MDHSESSSSWCLQKRRHSGPSVWPEIRSGCRFQRHMEKLLAECNRRKCELCDLLSVGKQWSQSKCQGLPVPLINATNTKRAGFIRGRMKTKLPTVDRPARKRQEQAKTETTRLLGWRESLALPVSAQSVHESLLININPFLSFIILHTAGVVTLMMMWCGSRWCGLITQVLRCAQTESHERHKITYRVNVKTQLDVMSL